MATGQWAPKCNIELVKAVYQFVNAVSRRRQIVWEHVFGHTGDVGNESADSLPNKVLPVTRRNGLLTDKLGPTGTNQIPRLHSPPSQIAHRQSIALGTVCNLLRETATEVLGTTKKNNKPSFFSPSDLDHILFLMDTQQKYWTRMHHARGTSEEPQLRTALQEAKKAVRTFKPEFRNR